MATAPRRGRGWRRVRGAGVADGTEEGALVAGRWAGDAWQCQEIGEEATWRVESRSSDYGPTGPGGPSGGRKEMGGGLACWAGVEENGKGRPGKEKWFSFFLDLWWFDFWFGFILGV